MLENIDNIREFEMAAILFHTLKFVKTLAAAGFPAEQAKGILLAFKYTYHTAEVATKSDIRSLEENMRKSE